MNIFQDFQEAVVIAASDIILWVAVFTLVEAIMLSVLTLIIAIVKRIW